jgi:hypothetical protein
MINQVRGRAIRYKSHSHLPEKERHVEVQRYHSIPQKSIVDKLLRRPRAKERSVDEYLYDLATTKQRLNKPFLDILKGLPAPQPEKVAELLTGVEHCRKEASAFAMELYGQAVGVHIRPPTVEEEVHDLAEPMPAVG